MREITRQLCMMALSVMPLSLSAQEIHVIRGNCLPDASGDAALARAARPYRLSRPNTSWDSTFIYKSPVILVTFSDMEFSMENPCERYDSIFNRKGYNEGKGVGCVADYFRMQSGGLFNTQFDVYGPVKVNTPAKSSAEENHGQDVFRQAAQAADALVDFSKYDWNGDGKVEQTVFVYAGYGGNEAADICQGHIWPNTSSFSTVYADGVSVSNYTASAEKWSINKLCGIGTICHEFSHSLGLPDLYPTGSSATEYSVVDQWDLMDGGNFINTGWCPTNYSALEKMLLGWLTPVELTEPATVVDLKPVSEGGQAYIIRHTANEYLLLENRQWIGWDLRSPGHGLLISHVDYNSSAWLGNTVNNTPSHHRYDFFHADNMTYDDWDKLIGENNPTVGGHNRILSTSPYPYLPGDGGDANRSLTDDSTPAAKMYNNNSDMKQMLSKAITDIYETQEGLISFKFMGGDSSTAIGGIVNRDMMPERAAYDIYGRRVASSLSNRNPQLRIIRQADGTFRKVIR